MLWSAPPPQPPPVAFHAAELHRAAHAIDVEILATTQVPVRVTVARHGTRLGRGADATTRGSTFVRVHLGPKGLRPLRAGLRVDVTIDYGAGTPLRARAALTRPPGGDTDDEVGLAS